MSIPPRKVDKHIWAFLASTVPPAYFNDTNKFPKHSEAYGHTSLTHTNSGNCPTCSLTPSPHNPRYKPCNLPKLNPRIHREISIAPLRSISATAEPLAADIYTMKGDNVPRVFPASAILSHPKNTPSSRDPRTFLHNLSPTLWPRGTSQ